MRFILFLLLGMSAVGASAQCTGYSMNITFNNPTCYGFCDGSLTAITTGGNGGDIFTITDSSGTTLNVGNGNTANSLCDGWYYVHVIDVMGCVLEDSVELIEPSEMLIDFTLSHPLCYGEASGSIKIDTLYNPTGNPNFVSYFWNPNPNSISPSGDSTGFVSAGTYVVNINDENGCSAIFDFDLIAPDALIFTDLGGENCVGGNDGVVYMAAGGGTPSYTYQWTDLTTMSTSGNTTWGGLNAGCYAGEVIDANGCILNDTICIGCLGIDESTLVEQIYPVPASDYLIIDLKIFEIVGVVISDLNGQLVYSESHYQSGTRIEVDELERGIYVVTVLMEDQLVRSMVSFD